MHILINCADTLLKSALWAPMHAESKNISLACKTDHIKLCLCVVCFNSDIANSFGLLRPGGTFVAQKNIIYIDWPYLHDVKTSND